MKQHITPQQIGELNFKTRTALKKRVTAVSGLISGFDMILSIGQMIALLGDDYIHSLYAHDGRAIYTKIKAEEVCDALWEAVKKTLDS